MDRNLQATIVFLLSGLSTFALGQPLEGQDPEQRSKHANRYEEPPGRDLFIPFVRTPNMPAEQEVRNIQQLRILAEMNKLTVELVKRRSNPYLTQADTAQLVKRLKRLAKELHELD